MRRALAACLLIALVGGLPAPTARAESPDEKRTAATVALKQLAAPIRSEREAARRRLLSLLPDVRDQLVKALRASPWTVQVQLTQVLAKDGAVDSVQALLEHLGRTDDTQAARLRMTIVQERALCTRLLTAWRADTKTFMRRVQGGKEGAAHLSALIELMRRAEIEDKFLSRKSKSGSTGYYQGQYDNLKGKGLEADYQKRALEVVTGIALDEAIKTPGIYRTGIYQFLRPHIVDEDEFQSMSLNAVSELATDSDRLIIERLERRRLQEEMKLPELETRVLRLRNREGYQSKAAQDEWYHWMEVLEGSVDLLTCLYLIVPDRFDRDVNMFVARWRPKRGTYRSVSHIRPYSFIAGVQIRCRWYRDAIAMYEDSMWSGGASKAYGYYNQACAYANWSGAVGLSKQQRERHVESAVRTLRRSVNAGWSDVGWMNEDRDLDPIRKHRRSAYDAMVRYIKVKYELDDD